ncbi:MAG: hypothetical protein MSH33_10345 [Fusobacterium necrophorum]|nr:hypothetical protein [Fusobacterium necrophorum]
MSRTTRFLKLFLPSDNDYYRVEQDQNENFEKIDKKLEEWDTGKEPTIKYKKTGFNLDKTDSYEENNTNKLATARALYLLWEAFKAKIKAIKLTWEAIEDKPSTFPPSTHYHSQYAPSSHTHDDRYYTQTKSDNRLNGLAGKKDGTFPLSSATQGNVYLLESTNKYYMCVKDYSSYYSISVPNENFIEMSVYENLNRLNNLDRKTTLKELKNSKITNNGSYVTIPDDFQLVIVFYSIGYKDELSSAVFVKGFDIDISEYGEEREIKIRLQGNKIYLWDKGREWDANIEKIYYM